MTSPHTRCKTIFHTFRLSLCAPSEMTDPLSIITSAITLLGTCQAIGKTIAKLICDTDSDATMEALRADVDSLSTDVNLVLQTCNQSQSSIVHQNLRVEIWNKIQVEQCECENILQEGNEFLGTLRPGFLTTLFLPSPIEQVQGLRDRISKHQRSLHFYVSLITK